MRRREQQSAGPRPTDQPIDLGVWAHEGDAGRIALFARHGYQHVRTFLRLHLDLAEPPAAPVWPAGIAVRGFRRHRDEAAVHAAMDEAFRDHWRPDVMSLEEWLAFRFKRPDLDLRLWWVAWAGDEVAGATLAMETPLGGYIADLAVRRSWRGRGLGRALLLQAFAELRRRGQARAYPRWIVTTRRAPCVSTQRSGCDRSTGATGLREGSDGRLIPGPRSRPRQRLAHHVGDAKAQKEAAPTKRSSLRTTP